MKLKLVNHKGVGVDMEQPTVDDLEALEWMTAGRLYYTIGKHKKCCDRLVGAGLIKEGENPVCDWPAYIKSEVRDD